MYIGVRMSVGIGYILPTIGEYMFVEFMYWYWIYSANNWGIYVKLNLYVSIGYILPTIEEYMLVKFIYWYWIYSINSWGIYVS